MKQSGGLGVLRALGGSTMCATGVGPTAQCQQQADTGREVYQEQPDASTTLNPKQVPTRTPTPFALPANSNPTLCKTVQQLVNLLHTISSDHIVHH